MFLRKLTLPSMICLILCTTATLLVLVLQTLKRLNFIHLLAHFITRILQNRVRLLASHDIIH